MTDTHEPAPGLPGGHPATDDAISFDAPPASPAERGKREAQDLVYDAWEKTDSDEALELILDAICLDPTNIDAHLFLAEDNDDPPERRLDVYRSIVAMAGANLGPDFIKLNKGAFWGVTETRPYMRARAAVFYQLIKLGRYAEAIDDAVDMLKLNPVDNQGIRSGLTACLLALNRTADAAKLRRKFGVFGGFDMWNHTLECFLAGDFGAADKALQLARQTNGWIEAHLRGHRQLPPILPDSYSVGSKEEAALYASDLSFAWTFHPAAIKWLKEQPRQPESDAR
jgi:hypothetical protein